jgi:acyl carrier protein
VTVQATDTLIDLEHELAALIVGALRLEIGAEDIRPDTPLFGDELGLDSIDMLEIALAVSKQYGFEIRADSVDNERIFASLRALAAHVAKHRTR